MIRQGLQRHLPIPAAVDRETGALLSLEQSLARPERAADLAALPVEKQIELVKARLLQGDWDDLLWGTDGLVDRERAIRELEARSPIGLSLLAVELKALAMLHEDATTSVEVN